MLVLKIVSPEKLVFTGEVDSVLVPGEVGQNEIHKKHAPIISTLVEGSVAYTVGSVKTSFQVLGGFVSVKKNEVSLCVEM